MYMATVVASAFIAGAVVSPSSPVSNAGDFEVQTQAGDVLHISSQADVAELRNASAGVHDVVLSVTEETTRQMIHGKNIVAIPRDGGAVSFYDNALGRVVAGTSQPEVVDVNGKSVQVEAQAVAGGYELKYKGSFNSWSGRGCLCMSGDEFCEFFDGFVAS